MDFYYHDDNKGFEFLELKKTNYHIFRGKLMTIKVKTITEKMN